MAVKRKKDVPVLSLPERPWTVVLSVFYQSEDGDYEFYPNTLLVEAPDPGSAGSKAMYIEEANMRDAEIDVRSDNMYLMAVLPGHHDNILEWDGEEWAVPEPEEKVI